MAGYFHSYLVMNAPWKHAQQIFCTGFHQHHGKNGCPSSSKQCKALQIVYTFRSQTSVLRPAPASRSDERIPQSTGPKVSAVRFRVEFDNNSAEQPQDLFSVA